MHSGIQISGPCFQGLQIHMNTSNIYSLYTYISNITHRLFINSKSNFVDWTIQMIYANVCAMEEIYYK